MFQNRLYLFGRTSGNDSKHDHRGKKERPFTFFLSRAVACSDMDLDMLSRPCHEPIE